MGFFKNVDAGIFAGEVFNKEFKVGSKFIYDDRANQGYTDYKFMVSVCPTERYRCQKCLFQLVHNCPRGPLCRAIDRSDGQSVYFKADQVMI